MPRSRRWIPPKTSTSILSGIVNVSSKSQLRQCHSHRHIHNSYLPSRSIDQVISLTPKSAVRSKLLPRHKQRRTLLRHIRKPKMGTARYSRNRPKTTSGGGVGRGWRLDLGLDNTGFFSTNNLNPLTITQTIPGDATFQDGSNTTTA